MANVDNKDKVAVIRQRGEVRYPRKAPFNPPERYPERPFEYLLDKTNKAYPLVREALHRLGLDADKYNTPSWNPMGEFIRKGDNVVIKPNWVLDKSEHDLDALITHMSIVRALVDYAWIACGKKGMIQILESPIQGTDWSNLMKVTGAGKTVDYLKEKGVNICLQDIRSECFIERDIINLAGWRVKFFQRKNISGTRRGFVDVNLGHRSMLDEVKEKAGRFRGIQYWTGKDASNAHNSRNHKYRIPREILESDVFINVPKLKTHRKAGVTLSLKNLVGIADKKEWLPHFIEGTPNRGGDEAPTQRDLHVRVIDALSIFSFFKRFGVSIRPPGVEKIWRKKIEDDLKKLRNVRQANWYGGDTVWRMVYDLNMILFHADAKGRLHNRQLRRYFCLIDGIVGGEKFGPLNSVPKKSGVVIAGRDPAFCELVGTRLMGFDEDQIKTLKNIRKPSLSFSSGDFNRVKIVSDENKWKRLMSEPDKACMHFIPAPGWKGHIELVNNIRKSRSQ
ncbi:DUF362 domain-containing protein [Candidatus Woesearchaeota archaeon]|nr:DUF362 domain-containing protein [Candidatus Woesearchaeota archaeon]